VSDIIETIAQAAPGLADDEIPKLFRPDTHYTHVGTEGEHGTGLGLTLCKELVEKHHGSIRVESRKGAGSAFRFTLPCCREYAQ